MKLTLEGGSLTNLVRGYSADGIRIGEELVRTSCIVTPDTLITSWAARRASPNSATAHVEAILALTPELVILGTGAHAAICACCSASAHSHSGLVGLEAMQLGAACRTFNVLVQEERRVAAALFVR